MTRPLEGRTVALAECRQLEELAQMLEKEGARPLRYPLVAIVDAPEEAPVLAWLRELIAGRFDYVVFYTGEGVRRLLGFADRANMRSDVIDALRRTPIVVRGPKPVRALKEVDLPPTLTAESPTTEGVIATLRQEPLRGKIVAVQLYAPSNPALEQFLAEAGATMAAVLPYVYAPAADADRAADLIARMARGEVDVLVLTSSPQIDRLFEIAAERKLEEELAAGLQRTRVAAVGPVVADNLRRRGAPVHICPDQGFVMKNLVRHIERDMKST